VDALSRKRISSAFTIWGRTGGAGTGYFSIFTFGGGGAGFGGFTILT